MLQVYNNLTRQKETFKPIIEGQVGLYVCGVTTYDYCHIGHGRTYTAFDVMARYLEYSGYDVTYVRNITDIDDKIINRANDNAESFGEVTKRFIDIMHEDFKALGLREPDLEPRATESIDGIIDIIQTLIDKGFAYTGADGDVYYSVAKFANYGQLSKQRIDDLRSGERVDVATDKTDPL
ncbi:MAG: class I tRNA ligase family protein, partial [Kangiellaceae bacterium]|nr:class I tRNA ligase family protein [Kangiellaceae bacterium]